MSVLDKIVWLLIGILAGSLSQLAIAVWTLTHQRAPKPPQGRVK